MSIHEFNSLAIEERATLVKESGTHLFSHFDKEINSLFYRLDDFNVEVWIDNLRSEIVEVQPIRRMAA
jgi:hypothetical protein